MIFFFFFFFLCVCVCVCVCVSERLDVGRHGVMVFVPLFLERKEEFRSFETFFFFFHQGHDLMIPLCS